MNYQACSVACVRLLCFIVALAPYSPEIVAEEHPSLHEELSRIEAGETVGVASFLNEKVFLLNQDVLFEENPRLKRWPMNERMESAFVSALRRKGIPAKPLNYYDDFMAKFAGDDLDLSVEYEGKELPYSLARTLPKWKTYLHEVAESEKIDHILIIYGPTAPAPICGYPYHGANPWGIAKLPTKPQQPESPHQEINHLYISASWNLLGNPYQDDTRTLTLCEKNEQWHGVDGETVGQLMETEAFSEFVNKALDKMAENAVTPP